MKTSATSNLILSIVLSLAFGLVCMPMTFGQGESEGASVYFSLDACYSTTADGSNTDYSEFTGEVEFGCSEFEMVTAYLYREAPSMNPHSCTPGVMGSPGMCVGSAGSCTYNPGSLQSVIIEVYLIPGNSGVASLGTLEFYENAPEMFQWINGNSGPNNYPTYFAVRVLRDGEEIFVSEDNPTENEWNLNIFNFNGLEGFTVTEATMFRIELTGYCPVGNGSPISVWDLDEILITSNCCEGEVGGTLTGGPFEFCVGDDEPDMVSGVELSGNSGTNSAWVVTDTSGLILGLPPTPEAVDFNQAGPGVCLIWHISYADGLEGLEMGNNAITDLVGCYDLSNAVVVVRNQPAGGELIGGPFEFCVGDGMPDMVSGIELSGASGPNSQWVVTDTSGLILGLPPMPGAVDFDGAGPGVCLIWHLSYADSLEGLEMGGNANDLMGCFSLSNPVVVYRNQPEGGVLAGGPFSFCVGDGEPDMVSGIELTGASGANSQWVVTDTAGLILGLPPMPGAVNFDEAGPGVCLIWHLSYADGLQGLETGANAADLEGCFSLSNPVIVIREQAEGGELFGGPFEFCVGDGEPDMVSGIELSGASGENSQWVVTDTAGLILGLPPMPGAVNFDEAGGGICLIWHLSYADGLEGLEMGNNAADLMGCFDLSNPVTVIRNQPEGGEITGGPFEFCVGDSMPDMVSGIELTGASGGNSQWVVTDTNGLILGLPPMPGAVDFNGAGPGVCLIWHLSYEDGLEGLEMGENAKDLMGCFSLSNAITVVRNQPEGGTLFGGPFEFCVGDGEADMVSGIELSGASGANSQWVVTDTSGQILGLPPMPGAVNFDEAGAGICLIWHLSYADGIEGLEMGNNAGDLSGCFSLSNPVVVYRNQPEGGTITGGPFEFCVGDSMPDMVSGIELTGASGANSQWVITDLEGQILGLPPMPGAVDFNGAGPGVCLIWHLSYADGLEGLEMGGNANDLEGCFSLSNSIMVVRNQPEGGTIFGGPFEFCVGDGEPDMVSGIELSGASGANSQWVITDTEGLILGLPPMPGAVDFNEAGPGTCLIWHLSYADGLEGLAMGENAGDLQGCFSLSNAIEVVRIDSSECENANFSGTFDFTPYPNPSNGMVHIKTTDMTDEEVLVEVFDAQGQVCYSQRGAMDNVDPQIDLTQLPSGQYFVRISSSKSLKMKSIVLMQ